MKEHTIWQNIDINVEDWKDFLEEEYPEITDENKQYDLICDMNNKYLNDERMNLRDAEAGKIIAIADLGLWHGRRMGYKEIKGGISDCLYDDCDYCKWYVDNRGEFRFTGHHHDGTNHYIYREVKPEISDEQYDNFLNKIYNGNATRRDITRYTLKLGDRISKIYGWN